MADEHELVELHTFRNKLGCCDAKKNFMALADGGSHPDGDQDAVVVHC